MFTRSSDFVVKMAIRVGKNHFLKELLRPLYDFYLNSINQHRNTIFKRKGIYVLKMFDKCMTENSIHYSLAFGTMLGAVREHGFIKHDLDIDVVIWNEDYSSQIKQLLAKYGFKLFHEITVDDGKSGREETYELDGVSIDIFYIYPALDEYPYCCDFIGHKDVVSFKECMRKYGYIIPRRIQLPWQKETHRVAFDDLSLPIPINFHEILSFRYGADYMTPNPNWRCTEENKYIQIWEGKKGVVKH